MADVQQPSQQAESDKQFVTTWLLSYFLGWLGIDRFYLGQTGLGVGKLLTFGGCGVWAFVDLILVLTGSMKDAQGRALAGYQQNKTMAIVVTVALYVSGILAYFLLFVGMMAASSI